VWLNGTLVSTYDDATRNGRAGFIGLENASNAAAYRHVRVRELAPDTVAPTVTIASPADGAHFLRGAAATATFACADESELASCTATLDGTPISSGAALPTAAHGPHVLTVTATDAEGHTTTRSATYHVDALANGDVGGTVPATLSLTLGAPASFGAFTPGVERTYNATTTANVISTAGDAALTITDPDTVASDHLVNGTFRLAQPLRVAGSALPATVRTWSAPVSNEVVPVAFAQSIGAGEPLRTGVYSKTLTFTLSTTAP
jgi:hypothetical protein